MSEILADVLREKSLKNFAHWQQGVEKNILVWFVSSQILCFLITAGIRRMGEGNVFDQFTPGEYPISGWGYSIPAKVGTHPAKVGTPWPR